jgi:alkylation response protein AidB-like acyl-CoA dehydrogenase
MPSPKLRIPSGWVPRLTSFVQLKPEELAAFLEAIRGEEPNLALKELTRSVAARLSMDRNRIDDIVRILAQFQAVREGMGLSISDFIAALRAAIEASEKQELHPKDWPSFEAALTEILSGESAVAISSKALQVLGQQHRLFCSAQVLSDLRPIFKSDVDQDPVAFVIFHSLKIVYHEADEHKELFVALDRSDLRLLSDLLDRALKKETSLRRLASEKHILVLEEKS